MADKDLQKRVEGSATETKPWQYQPMNGKLWRKLGGFLIAVVLIAVTKSVIQPALSNAILGPKPQVAPIQNMNSSQPVPGSQNYATPVVRSSVSTPKMEMGSLSISRIAISDTLLEVPTPKGFVRVEADGSCKRFLDEAETFVPKSNRLCAAFVGEQELGKLLNGESPTLLRYMFMEVMRDAEALKISNQQFGDVKGAVRTNMQGTIEKIQKDSPDLFDQNSARLKNITGIDRAFKISNIIPLPPHEDTSRSLSFSMYTKSSSKAADGRIETDVVVTTTVLLLAKGKMIFFYIYGSKDDLEWTRAVGKNWTAQILDANP